VASLLTLGALVCVLTIFNRKMMEAKLFGQLLEVAACRITYVSPDDILKY
jgi:hypothetical protein